MGLSTEKYGMIFDEALPLGLIANAAAILGNIEFPVPILRGSEALVKSPRELLYDPAFQEITAADFSDLAQGCKTYREFTEKWAGQRGPRSPAWVRPSAGRKSR